MRIIVLMAIVFLSACNGFGSRRPPPDPTEVIVTGAPLGAATFIDGVQKGSAAVLNDHPEVLRVKPGAHVVEIHVGEHVVYREEIDVGRGERRVVTVLSGSTR